MEWQLPKASGHFGALGATAVVGALATACAAYVTTLVRRQPLGLRRLCVSLPAFALLFSIPLVYDPWTQAFGVMASAAIFGWWSVFKLAGYAWGRGPLADAESTAEFVIVLLLPLAFEKRGATAAAGAVRFASPHARAAALASAPPSFLSYALQGAFKLGCAMACMRWATALMALPPPDATQAGAWQQWFHVLTSSGASWAGLSEGGLAQLRGAGYRWSQPLCHFLYMWVIYLLLAVLMDVPATLLAAWQGAHRLVQRRAQDQQQQEQKQAGGGCGSSSRSGCSHGCGRRSARPPARGGRCAAASAGDATAPPL